MTSLNISKINHSARGNVTVMFFVVSQGPAG